MDFSSRTDVLARHYRIPVKEVASKLGISQSMLFACRSKKIEPSLKTMRALTDAEAVAGLRPDLPRADISESSALEDTGGFYGGNFVITRELIEARIKDYLDAAEKVPGGLGYAWGQVSQHLTPHSLAALRVSDRYPGAQAKLAELKARAREHLDKPSHGAESLPRKAQG